MNQPDCASLPAAAAELDEIDPGIGPVDRHGGAQRLVHRSIAGEGVGAVVNNGELEVTVRINVEVEC